jgi:hypothetical protein
MCAPTRNDAPSSGCGTVGIADDRGTALIPLALYDRGGRVCARERDALKAVVDGHSAQGSFAGWGSGFDAEPGWLTAEGLSSVFGGKTIEAMTEIASTAAIVPNAMLMGIL